MPTKDELDLSQLIIETNAHSLANAVLMLPPAGRCALP